MKLKIIFILVTLSISYSCNKPRPKDLSYEDGRRFLDDKPYSGEAIDYWDDEENEIMEKGIYEDGYIRQYMTYHYDGKISESITYNEMGLAIDSESFDSDGILEKRQNFSRSKEGEYFVHEKIVEWFEKPCGKTNRKKKMDSYFRTEEMEVKDFVLEKIVYDDSYQVKCN